MEETHDQPISLLQTKLKGNCYAVWNNRETQSPEGTLQLRLLCYNPFPVLAGWGHERQGLETTAGL